MEEEKIRRIAELREKLEERARKLEAELEEMKILLDVINDLLLEKSFKKAEEIAKPVALKPPEEQPQPVPTERRVKTFPLKAATGELLADLYVEDGTIRVVPAADKKFNVNTPPFTAFLIERILAKMQQRDQELLAQGKMNLSEVFSFGVKKDGDILQEITIRNYAPQRERELKSATRWTLEKMYEKMKSSP